MRRHRVGGRGAPAGFTLVEAMVSLVIAAMAGATLLLGVDASIQATQEAVQGTIADGLAEQLMDEVLGARYSAVGVDGYQTPFSCSSFELGGAGRERYDDVDDFHGVRSQPPTDPWAVVMGTDNGTGGQRHPNFQTAGGLLDNWREEIDVYYVDESDLKTPLPAGQTSNYRMVVVRILRDDAAGRSRELANLRRVVAYVPPM